MTKNRRGRQMRIAALVLLLTIPLGYFTYSQHKERKLLLENAQASGLELQEIKNHSNAELRLKLFAKNIKLYSPFSLSNTNLDDFAAVIGALNENQTAFANLYENETDSQLITEHLYPISFWRSLLETETQKRNIIENPSKVNADEYLESVKTTNQEFANYISNRISLIENEPDKTLGYIDGTVKNSELIVWLYNLLEASKAHQTWTQKVQHCLERHSIDCTPTSPKSPVTSNVQTRVGQIPKSYDSELLTYVNNEHFTEAIGLNNTAFTEAPIIFSPGRCSIDDTADLARLWQNTSRQHALEHIRFSYTDELLFLNLVSLPSPYAQLLLENDVEFQFQPINHYLCWQYGLDIAEHSSNYSLAAELYQSPVFPMASSTNSVVNQLIGLEKEIITQRPYVNPDLIYQYVNLAREFLVQDSDDFSVEKQRLTRLLIKYQDKSEFVPEMLAALDHLFDYTLHVFTRTEVPDAIEIILTQSPLSLTLFPFNQTVAPQLDAPVKSYDSNDRYPALVQYPEDIGKRYSSREQLKEYIINTNQIIYELKINER